MVWLWVWGIVTAGALVIEFLKANLIFIWFAAGGMVTLLVEALVPSLAIIWQFVIFILASVGLLVSMRKISLKILNDNKISNEDKK